MSSWRGLTRVQTWPKKRGKPTNKDQANRQHLFRLFSKLIKALGPKETDYERRAIKNHNRTHRGQRGSAAIRFRDWQTQRLYGRGVAVSTSIGVVFYPPAVARDASFILDHVAAEKGQLMQRDIESWGPVTIGTPGQILKAGPIGQPCRWETL